jgi:photosystem II stability/assembly factor-like uncharacterized protein
MAKKQDAANAVPAAPTADKVAEKLRISLVEVEALVRSRAMRVAEIAELPEPVLRRALRRIRYPDLAVAREKFRLLHLRSASGPSVFSRRMRAVQHQDSLRVRPSADRIAGVPVGTIPTPATLAQPTAGVQAGNWTALGPGNIGGRTRAILLDPGNPNTMWAGSVGGGIWRTDNAGTNWLPADDLMANLAVCCLAMDPTNPKVIYAGTGEGFSNLDAIRGAGVFRTTDGVHWSQVTATAAFSDVNRLAVSADGKTVLAATSNGLLRSADATHATWQPVLKSPIADVRFHPTDPKQAIAGGLSDGQSYYSADGGQSWKPATHAQNWGGRVELTYALKNPAVVYASVNMNSGSIWRSQDGGKSYKAMKTRQAGNQPVNYLGDQGWYANTIWAADPTDENALLVGGLDLWRSSDGGDTLSQISLWYATGSAHADQHTIVAHPRLGKAGNKTVFFGNDGGIYRADNYTTVGNNSSHSSGWAALDNMYGVTQFYGGAGNTKGGVIVGGAQDNGTLQCTPAGGQRWASMFGGDGGWCAADANDSNYFYGEYVFLNICRSTDGGKTADYISGQVWNGHAWTWRPAPYLIPDATTQKPLFIAPFVLDPNNSNRMLAGGASLWRTDDCKTPNDDHALTGPKWASIKDPIGEPISALAIAPGDSDTVWVAYTNGAVFMTQNGTKPLPVWRQVGGPGAHPLSVARYCSSILIDAHDKRTVFVTFAAYRDTSSASDVWRTTDNGQTWTDIGHGLPDAPVHKLARHPNHPNYLYLGTEVGFFASDDEGTTWSPTNEGPTNCPVYDIFWMGSVLVCTTHGRGMFKISL